MVQIMDPKIKDVARIQDIPQAKNVEETPADDTITTYDFFGRLYPISWSWYETINDLLDSINRISWTTKATIWIASSKLIKAILGNQPVKMKTESEIAFQSYPQADPQPELYNGGKFHGHYPCKDEAFKRFFATEAGLNEYVKDLMLEKQSG